MRVYNAQNNYQKPVNFSGNYRFVYAKNGTDILYKTYTYAFRNDFEWKEFVRYISNKYKDLSKVNFIDHACSSGEEAFTIASMLINDLGLKEAGKFFPIIARDFDLQNIVSAKTGVFNASKEEMSLIGRNLENPNKFFECKDLSVESVVTAKPILTDNINFYKSNILTDIDKMPSKNTILLCRNIWLWLKPEQKIQLADKIANRFKDTSSLVVIGNADMLATDIHDQLLKRGFDRTPVDYVYARRKPVYSFYN